MANVAITDFDFSVEFNASIEMKVKAEQKALQAKNEKMKKITDAEAKSEEIRIEAKALAFKIRTESIAKAKAIRREAQALKQNPLFIEYRRIESWDGRLPNVTGGVIPMFDVKKQGGLQ